MLTAFSVGWIVLPVVLPGLNIIERPGRFCWPTFGEDVGLIVTVVLGGGQEDYGSDLYSFRDRAQLDTANFDMGEILAGDLGCGIQSGS